MNDPVKKFCYHHNIKIIDRNKKTYRYGLPLTSYFMDQKDYNVIHQDLINQTEPLLTLEIPESDLNKIAEFESRVFNHMKEHGHYDMFNFIMEQKEQEKYLRNKYTAVQKAYEQYSLMLKLAQSGEL